MTSLHGQQTALLLTPKKKRVPVILRCKSEMASEEASAKERSSEFRGHLEKSRLKKCLIQDNLIIMSTEEGLSLYAQARLIAITYSLKSCVLISHLENMIYCVEVDVFGTLLIETEKIFVDTELEEHVNFKQSEVVSIGETEIDGIDVIDAVLHLEGKEASKFMILPEVAAFAAASIPHPARYKKVIYIAIIALIGIGIAVAYYLYIKEQQRLEAEARAQSVPQPLVSTDMCLPQLKAYAAVLEKELPYLLKNGLVGLDIKDGIVKIAGKPKKATHKEFSKHLKSLGKTPIAVSGSRTDNRILKEGAVTKSYELSHDLTMSWVVENYGDITWQNRPQFGFRNYNDYSVAIYHKFSRLGPNLTISNLGITDAGDGRRIQEGQITINGELFYVSDLHRYAEALIGIPARCDQLSLRRDLETEKLTLEIIATFRGRL